MTDLDDQPVSWPCELCGKPSRYRVHVGCQAHIDENLAALPVLYRDLAEALQPGRRGGDGRGSSDGPPLPVNVRALNLRARGGIEGVVRDWETDARDILRYDPPTYYGSVEKSLQASVAFLRNNLNWLCDKHPAVKAFAEDIRREVAKANSVIKEEKPERVIPVHCATLDCGETMKITLSTEGRRCGGCDRQYTRDQLLRLQHAERRAVA